MRFRGRMISGEAVQGTVVVRFTVAQIIEARQAERVSDEIKSAMTQARARRLVIDFEGVTHMTSTMLGKLMQIRKAVLERQGEVRLCNLNEELTRLFKISGFRKLFDVHKSLEAALKK